VPLASSTHVCPWRDAGDRLAALYASRKGIGSGPSTAEFPLDAKIGRNYRLVGGWPVPLLGFLEFVLDYTPDRPILGDFVDFLRKMPSLGSCLR